MMIRRVLPVAVGIAVLVSPLPACQAAQQSEQSQPAAEKEATEATSEPHVVELSTTDHAFHAPAKIPSGWITFRLKNEGEEPHFFNLMVLPEGKTYDDVTREVVTPFHVLNDQYRAGTIGSEEMLEELDRRVPDWFWAAYHDLIRGGVGITSPGRTSQSTVKLEPGTYVMECYVVSPEGKFHNQLGMLRPLIVTDEPSGAQPPEADVAMTLSNYQIAVEGELTSGKHTVRVEVVEEPEGLLGHDVHLARLEEGIEPVEVAEWMDWVTAMQSPAPVEFLGGAEHVPVGYSSYISVDLQPGRYVWVSEGYGTRGVIEVFTVE